MEPVKKDGVKTKTPAQKRTQGQTLPDADIDETTARKDEYNDFNKRAHSVKPQVLDNNLKNKMMKTSNNNKTTLQQHDYKEKHVWPQNKDDMDSRENEEQDYKNGNVTHNTKSVKANASKHLVNNQSETK